MIHILNFAFGLKNKKYTNYSKKRRGFQCTKIKLKKLYYLDKKNPNKLDLIIKMNKNSLTSYTLLQEFKNITVSSTLSSVIWPPPTPPLHHHGHLGCWV